MDAGPLRQLPSPSQAFRAGRNEVREYPFVAGALLAAARHLVDVARPRRAVSHGPAGLLFLWISPSGLVPAALPGPDFSQPPFFCCTRGASVSPLGVFRAF